MLRSILRGAAATGPKAQACYHSSTVNYSSAKSTKTNVKKAKKSNSKGGGDVGAADDSLAADVDEVGLGSLRPRSDLVAICPGTIILDSTRAS